jgi:hypothetical protein
MKKFTWIMFFLLFFKVSAQTSYYVDTATGSDSNAGTSLTTAWKTIQKACTSATANSVVQIKGGSYYENIVMNVNGTDASNTITFKNYNDETVIIDGTGTSGSTMFEITNKSHLVIDGITIQNKTVNNAQGLLVESTGTKTVSDITLKNMVIQNINWTSSASTTPSSSKNAQGLIVYGGDGGITSLTVDNCEVSNCILGQSEALAINGNVDGFVVKNCKVHDNTNIGIDVIGHEGTASVNDEARNGYVSNNLCYNNVASYATSAGIYVDGASDIIIEKNACYNNGWGIEVGAELDGTTSTITVINNIIYNNQQAGLAIGGYDSDTTGEVVDSTVRNNTFYNNNTDLDGTGEMYITKASSCVFENNIFYTNSQNLFLTAENISPQTGNTFNYNCWYTPNNNSNAIEVNWKNSTYTKFSTYKTGTGQESNSMYANPQFTSSSTSDPNFYLLNTSPCVDAGNTATTLLSDETDYNDQTRIQNTTIDIGALEYLATLGVTKQQTEESFFIYPNPTTSVLRINSNTSLSISYRIYSVNGAELINATLDNSEEEIDVSNLADGLYFIKINDGTTKSFLVKK